MTEHGGHEHDSDDLREAARERMRDLPGETAAGRVDPATVPPEQWRKSRGIRPGRSSEDAQGDSEDSDEDPASWDESTQGEAAREALGVDPEHRSAGGVEPDATRDS